MYPRFLDVEASSLETNSYPIEVAWSDHIGNIESHLINPYTVDSWTDWDYEAQQVHGISRKMCREEGVNPRWLCGKMNHFIAPNESIYADGGSFDEHWIDQLYGAGSDRGFPKFKIVNSDNVMIQELRKTEKNVIKRLDLFEELKLEARKIVDGRHRARIDVQYLIELFKLCQSMGTGI